MGTSSTHLVLYLEAGHSSLVKLIPQPGEAETESFLNEVHGTKSEVRNTTRWVDVVKRPSSLHTNETSCLM